MIIHSLTLSQFQVDLEEANGRIVDLVAINNNLTSIKNKLETELSTAQADLDEVGSILPYLSHACFDRYTERIPKIYTR